MILKKCPAYEDCLLWFRTNGFDKEFFHCDGCTSYKCYELGFMEGAREAVKKMNELPESLLVKDATATALERQAVETYNEILRKLLRG